MPLKATRTLLRAALSGALADARFVVEPVFGLEVPVAVEGVDPTLLNPRQTWGDPAAYDWQAARLAGMFVKNFHQFESKVGADVLAAAPHAAQAVPA